MHVEVDLSPEPLKSTTPLTSAALPSATDCGVELERNGSRLHKLSLALNEASILPKQELLHSSQPPVVKGSAFDQMDVELELLLQDLPHRVRPAVSLKGEQKSPPTFVSHGDAWLSAPRMGVTSGNGVAVSAEPLCRVYSPVETAAPRPQHISAPQGTTNASRASSRDARPDVAVELPYPPSFLRSNRPIEVNLSPPRVAPTKANNQCSQNSQKVEINESPRLRLAPHAMLLPTLEVEEVPNNQELLTLSSVVHSCATCHVSVSFLLFSLPLRTTVLFCPVCGAPQT